MTHARTDEWIDRVPRGWRDARLKDMFTYAKGLNITKADLVDDGVSVVSYGQIHAKHNSGTHLDSSLVRFVPEELTVDHVNSRLSKGDIVFADTSEDLDGIGNCVLNDSDGTVYAGYHALVAKARFPEHSKYLSYLFQTDAWRSQIRTRSFGIKVFSLTQRTLNGVTVVLPPRPEQERIAAFLDAKCADVDKAIAAKRRQLEGLEKLWRNTLSLITLHGVQKKRLHASNSLAFPLLPQGWKIARLKKYFVYGKGLSFTKADLVDAGVAVVSYGQVHAKDNIGNHLADRFLRYIPEELTKSGEGALLKKGDIVFADTSEDLEGVGNCILNDRDDVVYGGYHTLIAKARFPVHSRYLSYLFQTDEWRSQLRKRACGIKVFSLTQRLLSNVVILIPPIEEQNAIADLLEEKMKSLDALAANLRRQIETLEEYRKSLIHECVTGARRVT